MQKNGVGSILEILLKLFFNFVDWFMALRFTASGALLAVKHVQILPMN
jgi:hypothetical protein